MHTYLIGSLIAATLLAPAAAAAQSATAEEEAAWANANDGAHREDEDRPDVSGQVAVSQGEWRARGRQKARLWSSSSIDQAGPGDNHEQGWRDRPDTASDGHYHYRNHASRIDHGGNRSRDGKRNRRYELTENERFAYHERHGWQDHWDRSWRYDDRYDWRGHRDRYHQQYRPGRYYAPYRGDYYRRYGVGIYIGSPYYSSRYRISDPWRYRLPRAYGPYRWVRYYDDVLLVDIHRGYVVDVIHNFFW